MPLSRRQIISLAGAGSAALLLAAFAFQLAGYAPCDLCILQRWPHAAAVVIAIIAVLTGGGRFWALVGAAAAAVATGLALYHTGVELHWWPGPAACTGGVADIGALSVDDLMQRIRSAEVVRCDQPAVLIFGFSMAAWNALASAVLTLLWLGASRRGA